MAVIHASIGWELVLDYFEDTVISSKTLEKHIDHVKQAVALLQRTEVTLELIKCSIFKDTIDHPEHVIRSRFQEISPHIAEAIQNFKQPPNISELRFFLRLCNLFRCFVLSFASIVAPLNRKLQIEQSRRHGILNGE